MIVISGALVLVALVLLVLGVTQSDINLVYGCIVVSLVSLVFLSLGIVQRRGEVLPGAAPPAEPHPGSGVAGPVSTSSAPAGADHPDSDDLDPDDVDDASPHGDLAGVAASGSDGPASAVAGTVLVVENRPRYHVDGCRYLAGKQAQEVDVVDAREAGFTACGVCKPDARLGATDGEPRAGVDLDGAPTDVTTGDTPGAAPGRQGSSRLDASPADPVHAPAVVPVGGSAVTPSAATQPEPGAQLAAVAGQAPAPGEVVVIPDRNRYHRADCRHVRGAAGAETLETSQASKQGYAACGVCKP